MVSELIDLQSAAERLGVHYQTAYKWVRSGQLPAQLVCNKYAIDLAELDAFAQQRLQPAPPTVRKPRKGFGHLSQNLTESLIAGDESLANKAIARLTADGVSLTVIIQEVVAPALTEIGTAWYEGRLTIWQEHRASGIIERILAEHYPNPRGRRRGTAVVAAVEGELHALPASMAAAALREDNWHVHLLGANLPMAELLDFCDRESPDLAVLTVTNPELQNQALLAAAQVEGCGVRIIVGHPGGSLLELQELAKAT